MMGMTNDKTIRLALLCATLLLAGCSTLAWQRPGTPEAQARQDVNACRQWAQALPPAPTPLLSTQSKCATYGLQAQCTVGPGPLQDAGGPKSQRAVAMEACLLSKGYTRQ